MLQALIEYLLFLAQTLTLVVALLAGAVGLAFIARRARPAVGQKLEVHHLNRDYEAFAETLRAATRRGRPARSRRPDSAPASGPAGSNPRLFVLDFHGDLRASAVSALREEITAILTMAAAEDEVLVRLESAGGQVHAYGLAASQLSRLKQAGLRLTVAVDKIAASGGYLMACVADRIIAAPFAILGSIGVVAQLPNFNRLLRRHDIDFEQFTAGRFKRTVTLFGENTHSDREKLQADVNEAHRLLQAFVHEHRPMLDLEQTATGEHWYGSRALELNLVDALQTSDDYLLQARAGRELLHLKYRIRRGLAERLRAMLDGDA